MSANTNPVTSTQETTSAPVDRAAGAPTGKTGEFNASTTVGSLQELQSKAPTVYKAMMEGIAMNIVNEMKDHQDRIKEMNRQAARDAAGQE